jgi:hypothetical protein
LAKNVMAPFGDQQLVATYWHTPTPLSRIVVSKVEGSYVLASQRVHPVALDTVEYDPGKHASHCGPPLLVVDWFDNDNKKALVLFVVLLMLLLLFVKKPALQVHSCGDEAPVLAVVEKRGQPWQVTTDVAPVPVK